MMQQFLASNFGLPAGGIYSNLIASGICFVLAGVWAHHKIVKPMREHHRRIERHLGIKNDEI